MNNLFSPGNLVIWLLVAFGIRAVFSIWRARRGLGLLKSQSENFKNGQILKKEFSDAPRALKKHVGNHEQWLKQNGYSLLFCSTNPVLDKTNFTITYISSDRTRIFSFQHRRIPHSIRLTSLLVGYVKEYLTTSYLLNGLEVRVKEGEAIAVINMKMETVPNGPRPAPFLHFVSMPQSASLDAYQQAASKKLEELGKNKNMSPLEILDAQHYMDLSQESRRQLAAWDEKELKRFLEENELQYLRT